MSHTYWRLLGIVSLCLIAGVITGKYALCLLIGLFSFLLWHFIKLEQLIDWFDKKRSTPPDINGGPVERIIEEIDSLHKRHKYHSDKLTGYLKQFQQATNALPDAVVVLDQQGGILGANSKAGVYLNIHWAQDSGQRISNLVRHPLLSQYLRDFDTDPQQGNLELTLPHSQHRRLEIRLAPFGDTQRLLIARDITQVHQANEIRKDFIANASHELRSPLTVISGYLESFENDLDECPDSWRPIINQMRDQSGRMQRLIEDLLQLSSLESSESPMHQESVRVGELLFSIYKEAEIISGIMQHIFFIETDPDLCLLANQSELYSAFSNLIFNAVQYTPSKGVIRIRWYEDEAGAHMEVSDTGDGIPKEHINRLTERFYRVDKGRSREKGGTGLGLAIVKHILARHDASLHIESEIGRGSLFRCDFPKQRISPRDSTEVSKIA